MLAADHHLVFHVDIWPGLTRIKLSCCSGAGTFLGLHPVADMSCCIYLCIQPEIQNCFGSGGHTEGSLGFLPQLDLQEKKWVQTLSFIQLTGVKLQNCQTCRKRKSKKKSRGVVKCNEQCTFSSRIRMGTGIDLPS